MCRGEGVCVGGGGGGEDVGKEATPGERHRRLPRPPACCSLAQACELQGAWEGHLNSGPPQPVQMLPSALQQRRLLRGWTSTMQWTPTSASPSLWKAVARDVTKCSRPLSCGLEAESFRQRVHAWGGRDEARPSGNCCCQVVRTGC